MSAWSQNLLIWYGANRRSMPWRGSGDPYAVWVSEIMLQQTQVATVTPYFQRFLRSFSDIGSLAAAPEEAVLKAWEGLGYYSRARNLRRAARQVVEERGGTLPRTARELSALPGIGPYTAAAIASICFGERVPVVDGNVVRVFARLLARDDDFRKPVARSRLAEWLMPHLKAAPSAGDFNQAMMELGALICKPRKPGCGRCPLSRTCRAHKAGRETAFPVRTARTTVPTRHAAAVLIRRDGRLLLLKRADKSLLGGLWELPGGESPRAPTAAQAANLVRRQTGLLTRGLACRESLTHVFSHFRLKIRLFACDRATGRLRTRAPHCWAGLRELARLPVVTAHRSLIAKASQSRQS